jgi:hypothetical protein
LKFLNGILANIQRGNRKEEMSDARECVEAIIARLLDKMELEAKIEMREQVNFGRMQFNWTRVNPIYEG